MIENVFEILKVRTNGPWPKRGWNKPEYPQPSPSPLPPTRTISPKKSISRIGDEKSTVPDGKRTLPPSNLGYKFAWSERACSNQLSYLKPAASSILCVCSTQTYCYLIASGEYIKKCYWFTYTYVNKRVELVQRVKALYKFVVLSLLLLLLLLWIGHKVSDSDAIHINNSISAESTQCCWNQCLVRLFNVWVFIIIIHW